MRLDHLLSKEGRSKGLRYCLVFKSAERRKPGSAKVHEEDPVVMRIGETPVPIPNTTVKTYTADGTMLETAWESRWLPDH